MSLYLLRCEGDNFDDSLKELIRSYAYGMRYVFDLVSSNVLEQEGCSDGRRTVDGNSCETEMNLEEMNHDVCFRELISLLSH
jgi:hypothetical protein